MTCAWIETSSADTGSSQTISFGLDRERARDADALALAAGEFVRIAAHVVGLQADRLEQLATRSVAARLRDFASLWMMQRLADDRADRHARIERGERILEDDLHVAAQRAQRIARSSARHVLALEPRPRPSVGSISRRMQRPVVDLPQPGFADQAERLAGAMSKRHAVDRMDAADLARQQAAGDGEIFLQVADAAAGARSCRASSCVSPRMQAMRWPGAISRSGGSPLGADVHGELAARGEAATDRRIDQARHRCRRSPRAASCASPPRSMRGIERIRPCV